MKLKDRRREEGRRETNLEQGDKEGGRSDPRNREGGGGTITSQ